MWEEDQGHGQHAGFPWLRPLSPPELRPLLELGELVPLPEGSLRPGSKHRDDQITRARPAHLHGSTLLYKGQRSKALGKLWPQPACVMPPRHTHRNLDGSLAVLGKTGYVSKAQLLHITA